MINVSQSWKEKLGNYNTPNRDYLTPEELIKIEYNIDGQTLTFTKNDIMNFTHTNNVDLNSLTLPKDEIKFEIRNDDNRWNPDNPQGLYNKITEKQKVDLYYGLKVPATKTYTNMMPERANAYVNSYNIQFRNNMTYLASSASSTSISPFRFKYTPTESGLYYIGGDTWFESGTPSTMFLSTFKFYLRNNSASNRVFYYYVENVAANTHYTHKGYYQLTAGTEYEFFCLFDEVNNIGNLYSAPFIVKVDNETTIPSGKMFLLDETYSIEYLTEEWHKAGTFWMSSWDTPQNGLTASFTATSQLDFGTDKFGEVNYTEDAPTYKDVCETAASHMGLYTTNYYVWQKWNVGSIALYSVQIDRTHYISQGYTSLVITDIPPVGNRQIYYSSSAPTLNSETGKLNFIISGSSYSGVDISGSNSFCIAGLGHSVGTTIQVSQVVSSSDLFQLYSDGIMEYTGYQGENAPSLTYVQTTYAPGKGSISYGEVSSTNSSAYPQDGQQGDYWYVYNRQEQPDISVDSSLDNYAVPATSTTKYKYEKWDYSSTYTAATESMSMPEGTTNVCDGNTYVVSANNWTTDYDTGEYVGTVLDATTGMLQLSSSLGFFTSATGTIGETIRTPYKFYYPYTSISSRYMDSNGNIINQSGVRFSLNKNYFNETKTKGTTHIEDVIVDTQSYPTNGYQDGYWWVYVGEVNEYVVDMFNSTTDAQVIQYCANAAQCSIRYDVDGKIHIEPFDVGAELTDYQIDLFTSYKLPEYNMSKQIKNVIINNNLTAVLLESGENQQISNSLITTQLHANLYAGWLGRVINTRKEISGTYRCDPRLLPYDYIKVWSKYALNECFITSLTINYAGSFKADYTARVIKSINQADVYGLYYAGDKQRAGNSIS